MGWSFRGVGGFFRQSQGVNRTVEQMAVSFFHRRTALRFVIARQKVRAAMCRICGRVYYVAVGWRVGAHCAGRPDFPGKRVVVDTFSRSPGDAANDLGCDAILMPAGNRGCVPRRQRRGNFCSNDGG